MKFVIEKGVAIPSRTEARGRKRLYHFEDMEIGDSVPCPTLAEYKSAMSSAYKVARTVGTMKFYGAPYGNAYRIWRSE